MAWQCVQDHGTASSRFGIKPYRQIKATVPSIVMKCGNKNNKKCSYLKYICVTTFSSIETRTMLILFIRLCTFIYCFMVSFFLTRIRSLETIIFVYCFLEPNIYTSHRKFISIIDINKGKIQ